MTMPGARNVGKQMLHRQTNDGSGARQPGIDTRIGRDDFVEPEMVLAGDVGQRVLLFGLGLAGLADHVLVGRQRKNLRMRRGEPSIRSSKTKPRASHQLHRSQ